MAESIRDSFQSLAFAAFFKTFQCFIGKMAVVFGNTVLWIIISIISRAIDIDDGK